MDPLSPYVGEMFDGSSAEASVETNGVERTKTLDEAIRGQLLPAIGDLESQHLHRLLAVNIGTAGLCQLFERTCTTLARTWTGGKCESVEGFVDWLRTNLGIDLQGQPCWLNVHELRLAARVMRHGDGASAEELRRVNPSLFSYPGIDGNEVCITEADFPRYAESLIALWSWLGGELRGRQWKVSPHE